MTETLPEDAVERRFATVARHAREQKGWPQGRIAETMSALGWPWHQQTVARVEHGDRMVRLGEAVALAAILGIDLSAFAAGDSEPWRTCLRCGDRPPSGFTCNTCGRVGP